MRTFVGLMAVFLGLAGLGQAQTPAKRLTVIIAPNIERTVTVSKSGVVLASMTVSKGTILSVSYDAGRGVLPSSNGRFDFYGDIEVHAQSASLRDQRVMLEQEMAQSSPLLLIGKDVDVVIVPVVTR